MQIDAAQMRALSEARKNAFIVRVRRFIHEQTRREPQENVLVHLFDRASSYGLITEQQYAGYILLAWQAGVRPPGSDPSWIAEIMHDRSRPPEDKLTTLFDRAKLQPEAHA